MPLNCLLPQQAERLKKAFRDKRITFSMLYKMTPAQRLSLFEKYLGSGAKMFSAKIDKAFLMPNQKRALKSILEKDIIGRGQLYQNISLSEAEKMRNNLDIKELKKMSSDDRLAEFKKYLNSNNALILNEKFEYFKDKGDLASWEKRAFGTDILAEEKRLKGHFAKLEQLNDLGVLNPKQLEDFMQSLTEIELGVSIDYEQTKKLSKLTTQTTEAFDKLTETNNWTGETKESYNNVLNYYVANNELTKYTEQLESDVSIIAMGNEIVEISRNNILGTPYSGRNSFLYQIIPTMERFITKRLTLATIKMEGGILDKISAKISKGLFVDKEGRKLIRNQLKLGLDIYDKTSQDISRMTTLNDGYKFFGEKERGATLSFTKFKKDFKQDIIMPIKEARGMGKIREGLGGFAKITGNFPKWMAGGSDTLIANATKAETVILWANETARFEKRTGKLLKGMTEKERAKQLFLESYNPNTKSIQAQIIRSQSIFDAHYSNNTQPDGMADWTIRFRDSLGLGKFKFGRAISPFVKITSTTISRGLQTALGIGPLNLGVAKEIINLNKAYKNTDKLNGTKQANKAISNLIGYVGLSLTALLIASLLDDDDYIPPYASMSFKEYNFALARGARPDSIRIGGKWIPLRFLPMINIPVSSIMMARQAKTRGESVFWGYIKGIYTSILDTPVLSDFYKLMDKGMKSVKQKDIDKVSESTGLNFKDIWDFSKIRMIPAMLSRDLYDAILPTTKYNFLGEEIEKAKVFRDDKTDALLIEFNELDKRGFMPTISNPSGKYAIELEKKLGEKEYYIELSKLQKVYAEEVLKEINKDSYKRKDFDEKKKEIDDIRQNEILDELEKLNNKL